MSSARRSPRPVTVPERRRMAEMWRSGMSARAIGRETGRTWTVVIHHLRAVGIEPYHRPRISLDELRRRIAAGETQAAIEEELEYEFGSLSSWITKLGGVRAIREGRG